MAKKLICSPFAGAGASFYKSWQKYFSELDVIAIQLPGREQLIDEKPYDSVDSAVSEIIKGLINEISKDDDIYFWGHCFLGGILSFEIARKLQSLGYEIKKLFLSAAAFPYSDRTYSLSNCPDDEIIEKMEELTGYTHPAFNVPELRELLIPALKADFRMDETYYPNEKNIKIDIPIDVIISNQDEFVSQEDVLAWETITTNEFSVHKVNGRHMYLSEKPETCIEIIKNNI